MYDTYLLFSSIDPQNVAVNLNKVMYATSTINGYKVRLIIVQEHEMYKEVVMLAIENPCKEHDL